MPCTLEIDFMWRGQGAVAYAEFSGFESSVTRSIDVFLSNGVICVHVVGLPDTSTTLCLDGNLGLT